MNGEDRWMSAELTNDGVARRRYLGLAAAAASLGLAGCVTSAGTRTDGPAAETTDASAETAGPETTAAPSHEVRRNVMVEMRDGVKLATDVHLPPGEGPFPTLVNRTPYDKSSEEPIGGIAPAVERGYAVVQQDVRGRFASEGWFEPFFEGEDGYDTVEWAAEREWSTGDVGMYGVSYRGMATIRALDADPPSLVAAAPLVTPANFYADLQYSGGADNLGTSMAWTTFNSFSQVSRLDVSEATAKELRAELQRVIENWPDSAAHLPTVDVPAFDRGVAQYWRDWHSHPTYDNFWKALDLLHEVADVSVPVFHVGGWYDIFLRGTTSLFSAIRERGTDAVCENQRMVLGPWTHGTFPTADPVGERDFGPRAAYDVAGELLFPWFDHWLKGEGDGLEPLPTVQYFQTGADEWRNADRWPPADAEPTPYYLAGDAPDDVSQGSLAREEPTGSGTADSYEYDPSDPVPTRGGPILMGPLQQAGVVDQRPVERRDDVLTYTSERLSDPVSVAGDVDATLFVETTAPDTDFVVRLVDVRPDGYAANVTEGTLRARYRNSFEDPEFLEPGTVYELDVSLRPVAHTFRAGHRVRLDVTSSSFPKHDRNPNAAVPVARATEADFRTATQTLRRDAERPSRVVLPVRE